jgi:hypothetical protein
MAIETGWYDSNNDVILVTVTGVWTWAEMEAALNRCNELFDSVSHPVYSIFDFSRAASLPQGILTNIRRVNRPPHPNSTTVMIVGLNAAYRMILDIFTRLYGRLLNPHGVHLVNNLEQADELLVKLRSLHSGSTP